MKHWADYVDWLCTLDDETLQRETRWIPVWVMWAQLWDLWDLLTAPVRWAKRRLRRSKSDE